MNYGTKRPLSQRTGRLGREQSRAELKRSHTTSRLVKQRVRVMEALSKVRSSRHEMRMQILEAVEKDVQEQLRERYEDVLKDKSVDESQKKIVRSKLKKRGRAEIDEDYQREKHTRFHVDPLKSFEGSAEQFVSEELLKRHDENVKNLKKTLKDYLDLRNELQKTRSYSPRLVSGFPVRAAFRHHEEWEGDFLNEAFLFVRDGTGDQEMTQLLNKILIRSTQDALTLFKQAWKEMKADYRSDEKRRKAVEALSALQVKLKELKALPGVNNQQFIDEVRAAIGAA